MTMINDLISSFINWMHKKVDAINNDWVRRSVGLLVFLLMIFIGLVGCLIELIGLCIISVSKTVWDYLSNSKDDAISFVERYIDLW
jgi:hypothetical protein